MKIVFVNPPILDRKSIEIPTRAHNPFEHLGLCYIGAMLRQRGHDVKIVDSYVTTRSIDETLALIEKESPDLVGFSATHEFLTASVILSKKLRENGYEGHITLGGYLSTFMHDQILSEFPQINSVIRGEGEYSIIELAENLHNMRAWCNIPGLSFACPRGGIRINKPGDLIEDLDSLPFPIRDTLPELARMHDYSAISSSRGCPMDCAFCSIKTFYGMSRGVRWRARSAVNVVDEMQMLVEEYKIGQIAFTDDNFMGPPGAGPERALKIGREILKRGLKVDFSILVRVDALEEGLLRLLKMAGLRSLFVGFESGVDRALKTFNKRITVEQNRNAVQLIHRIGIRCFPGFIMFDPWTTMEDIRQNLAFIDFVEKTTDLVVIDDYLGSLQPFTGTDIRDTMEDSQMLFYPQSELLAMDLIPSYTIADPGVEALRHAVKTLRNSMKRPLFDEINVLKKTASDTNRAEMEQLENRFNSIVRRLREFEIGFFRETLERIEKDGMGPDDMGSVIDSAGHSLKKYNEDVDNLNRSIRDAEGLIIKPDKPCSE